MLKKLIYLWRTGNCRNQKQLEGTQIKIVNLTSQQKDLNVRIVHAGGLVELYKNQISAYEIMEKYPGMCLSRPEIFKQPHDSIIHPYDKLEPGQKFYLIPTRTVRKLKKKHGKKPKKPRELEEILRENVDDSLEHSFRSAKDYFYSRCALSRGEKEVKKPFNFKPPIGKPRMWRNIVWQPTLPSVEEGSP